MDYLGDQYTDFLNDPELAKYRTKDDTANNKSSSNSWSPDTGAWTEFGTTLVKTAGGVIANIAQLKAMERASTSETEKAQLRQQIALLEKEKLSNETSAPPKGEMTKGLAIGGAAAAGILALISLK